MGNFDRTMQALNISSHMHHHGHEPETREWVSEMRWTCKDGTEVRLRDMTESHLYNARKWLERRIAELDAAAEDAFLFSGGEIAEMEMHNAGEVLSTQSVMLQAWLDMLNVENLRRGI